MSEYVEKLLGYSVQQWLSTPNFWLAIVRPEDLFPKMHLNSVPATYSVQFS